jgi:hypothetical protein
VTHIGRTYVAGDVAAEAVAAVACDLIAAGPFLTIAMPVAAGVEDNCRLVVGHCCCMARRARFLAGLERSILSGEVRNRERGEQSRGEEKKRRKN